MTSERVETLVPRRWTTARDFSADSRPPQRRRQRKAARRDDSLVRLMGWFGIGLGLGELLAGDRLAMALGRGDEALLIRACGAREIGSGMLCLAAPGIGITTRILGDVMDVATLVPGLAQVGDGRRNSMIALGVVAVAAMLDVAAAARFRRG